MPTEQTSKQPAMTEATEPAEGIPAVSVVVPCYNVQDYVRETLDSLIAQTLTNIEIICVNDGSTDGTLAILQEFAERDARVVVVDKPNGGYGHAMNVGMDAAHGEYIGIVESDDFVEPAMFQTLYECAKKNNLDFVKSDFVKFWTREDGTVETKPERLSQKKEYYDTLLDPAENLDLFNAQMLNWAGIYKTSFIRENHICHNESPGASYQDNGFWFQVFTHARCGMFLHDVFYHYRQDNANSSINQTNKVFCMLDEYRWIYDRLKADPALAEKFVGIYHYKKTHNLDFAFSLLADEFQLPFLERYSREYNEAAAAGELDKSFFYPDEWKRIQAIMRDPAAYRDEYNASRKSQEYLKGYELARGKGKASAALYVLKHDGLTGLIKKLR